MELRVAIDDVDRKILDLIRERLDIVVTVGNIKRERGIEVYDPARERALLEKLGALAKAPLDAGTVRRIFERVVDECRRIEQRHVDQSSLPNSPDTTNSTKD
jgi:chorismate mutase